MSPEELTKILQSHKRWLTSDHLEGERANLEDAELRGADIQNAFLDDAEFKNANLTRISLQGAELSGASFDGAELQGADLRNAILNGAEFKNAGLRETDLQRAQLEEASFDGAKLPGADLRRAILNRAVFKGADLTGANLQGAELRGTDFHEAILKEANLRDADLQNADLENAEFLLTTQLAGADVAGAKLPKPIAEFEGLKTIAEATSNAQKLFVAMLGGCLYSWLTIGTTKDAALLTNSASSPLPIIGTALPIVGFYAVAPIVLLAMYFYFHLNMQRLWEALADLPAIFPDGRSLDKRADPWLLNGLVSAHFVRLRHERPALSRVQQSLSILLAWWVVPITLFAFWGRFLMRHDWLGTSLHIGLLAAAIGFGWMSYRLARGTLCGARHTSFIWSRLWQDPRTHKRAAGILGICALGATFYYISWGAIEGIPPSASWPYYLGGYIGDPSREAIKENDLRRFVPNLLESVGVNSFANLEGEDVSIKPANWTGDPKDYPLVRGARLERAKMQYANARRAFLVNSSLVNSDLSHAVLRNANLSHADLELVYFSYADLRNANFSYAKLSYVDVTHADLTNVDLTNANISSVDFSHADLSNATLRSANFQSAGLSDANLTRADFSSANLTGVAFLDANVSEAVFYRTILKGANFTRADLSHADLSSADLSNAKLWNANLGCVDFSSANLSGATLLDADLSGAILDKTILKGAELTRVKGLTRTQLQKALTDEKTILPENLPP